MKKFCIVTLIIDNFEPIHEPLCINNADYFLLTNTKDLVSNVYKTIYIDEFNSNNYNSIQRTFILKYTFYKYIPNLEDYDYIIFIDGSIQINNSLQPLIDFMRAGDYDLSVAPHPIRDSFEEEYKEWIRSRHMPEYRFEKFLNATNDYDYKNIKGLVETSMKIFKVNKIVFDFIDDVHKILNDIADNADNNDQCYLTYILYKYLYKLKINYHPASLYRDSQYMAMKVHGSNAKQMFIQTAYKEGDVKLFLNRQIKINSLTDYIINKNILSIN